MPSMHVDLAGALLNGARVIRQPDPMYREMVAFGLEEIAGHVQAVQNGNATLKEFCNLYCLPYPQSTS